MPLSSTTKKWDVTLRCEERKIIHFIRLTVYREDNLDAAQDKKDGHFETLLEN